MSSTFQSFVKFIFTFVIVNITLLVLRHQPNLVRNLLTHNRQNTDEITNITKNFEVIVSEYKRILKLKSVDVIKTKSQFDKLVQQYKKSAPKDILDQLYQKADKNQENKGNVDHIFKTIMITSGSGHHRVLAPGECRKIDFWLFFDKFCLLLETQMG